MAEKITIFEVGARDGLQNEKMMIPSEKKIELIDKLSGCGFKKIEVTAFVSPKWVPQMGDAAEVMDGITRQPGVIYGVLTPNMYLWLKIKGREHSRKNYDVRRICVWPELADMSAAHFAPRTRCAFRFSVQGQRLPAS